MKLTTKASTLFRWGNFRWLGNSRLVKSSYLWFFVVPVVGRLAGPFAGEHDLSIPWLDDGRGRNIHVNVALPFSWVLFYFMSIMFMLGQLVYWIRCPQIVKRYESFGDLRRDHAGPWQLIRFADDALSRADQKGLEGMLSDIDCQSAAQATKSVEGSSQEQRDVALLRLEDIIRRRLVGAPNEGTLSRAFESILRAEQTSRRGSVFSCAAFFALGLLLFLYVVGENLMFTVKLILKSV